MSRAQAGGDLVVLQGELVVVGDLLVDRDGLLGVDDDLLLGLDGDHLGVAVGLEGEGGGQKTPLVTLVLPIYCSADFGVDQNCSTL